MTDPVTDRDDEVWGFGALIEHERRAEDVDSSAGEGRIEFPESMSNRSLIRLSNGYRERVARLIRVRYNVRDVRRCTESARGKSRKSLNMAPPAGVEPTTYRLGVGFDAR